MHTTFSGICYTYNKVTSVHAKKSKTALENVKCPRCSITIRCKFLLSQDRLFRVANNKVVVKWKILKCHRGNKKSPKREFVDLRPVKKAIDAEYSLRETVCRTVCEARFNAQTIDSAFQHHQAKVKTDLNHAENDRKFADFKGPSIYLLFVVIDDAYFTTYFYAIP